MEVYEAGNLVVKMRFNFQGTDGYVSGEALYNFNGREVEVGHVKRGKLWLNDNYKDKKEILEDFTKIQDDVKDYERMWDERRARGIF